MEKYIDFIKNAKKDIWEDFLSKLTVQVYFLISSIVCIVLAEFDPINNFSGGIFIYLRGYASLIFVFCAILIIFTLFFNLRKYCNNKKLLSKAKMLFEKLPIEEKDALLWFAKHSYSEYEMSDSIYWKDFIRDFVRSDLMKSTVYTAGLVVYKKISLDPVFYKFLIEYYNKNKE